MTPADMAQHIPAGSEPVEYMEDVTRRHRGHFFDEAAMRYFRSRLPELAYQLPNGGAVFVSSEQHRTYLPDFHDSPRAYTVRVQGPDGDIGPSPDMPGLGFQHFETRGQADTFARRWCRTAWAEPERWGADMLHQRTAKHWPDKLIGGAFGISYQRAGAIMRAQA